MAKKLELVMPIVENGMATPYFEDYLFEILQAIGGEGGESGDSNLSGGLVSQIAALSQDLDELKKEPAPHMGAVLQRLEELELSPTQMVTIIQESFELNTVLLSRIGALEQRINDLELQ